MKNRGKLTQAVIDGIRQRKAAGEGQRQIARELGVAGSTVSNYSNQKESDAATNDNRRTFTETGDKAELTYTTDHRIRTKEDAIKYGEVDLTEWNVTGMKLSSWEVVAKDEALTTDANGKVWKVKKPKHHHLWGVKLELERIMPKPYFDAVKMLFVGLKPPPLRPCRAKPPGDKLMFMFGLFDAHFGKLAWGDESGQDYDLDIAESVYANAVDDLIARVSHLRPELILFPVGNDFVHTDSQASETSHGTVVSSDSRHAKMIRVAFRAQIQAIERMQELAPVDCFHVPGNHDELGSYYLALALDARFHGSRRVTVDLSPKSRKYRRYGETMLGFTHGQSVKASQVSTLAGIMMHEQRQELRGTTYSEWFTGHNHRTLKYEDTHQGTVVRSLGSLSAVDEYLFNEGFVGSRRAAEVYVYERAGGYCGHWVATARPQ